MTGTTYEGKAAMTDHRARAGGGRAAAAVQCFETAATLAVALFPDMADPAVLFPDRNNNAGGGGGGAGGIFVGGGGVNAAINAAIGEPSLQLSSDGDVEHIPSALPAPIDAGDALLVQSPRRSSRRLSRKLVAHAVDAADVAKEVQKRKQQRLALGWGGKVLRQHAETTIVASLATLCGPKDKQLFAVLHEHTLRCYKSLSAMQSLNLVIPLARHPRAAALLGRCDPGRREVTICLSPDPRAQRAVAQLKAAVSANFPLVLRFGTQREFQRWCVGSAVCARTKDNVLLYFCACQWCSSMS